MAKIFKVILDNFNKATWEKNDLQPRGLYELSEYFRNYDPIHFTYHNEDGLIIAVSSNFRLGSIVTEASNLEELDRNIKDAILTSFEIPSSYAMEAQIRKEGETNPSYVLA